MLIYIILLILLSISSYTDLFYKKIYNFITLPTVALGVLLNAIINGLDGLLYSLIGAILGFSLHFILYMLGGMGGGDVKLMSAVGALIGWKLLIWSIIFSSFVGGSMAIAVLLKQQLLLITFHHILQSVLSLILQIPKEKLLTNKTKVRIPYAIAIAIGTMLALLTKG